MVEASKSREVFDLTSKEAELFIKQTDEEFERSFDKQPSSTSPLLKLALISLRNHWLINAPTVLVRFLSSNYPQVLESVFNIHMTQVHKIHKVTDYMLAAVGIFQIIDKWYLNQVHVKRPPIQNKWVRLIVRHHWKLLPVLAGLTYCWESYKPHRGMYPLAGFHSKMDLFILIIGALLLLSKLYLFKRVESIESQIDPKVVDKRELGAN